MAQDIERLVQPFRDKPDGNWGFRSEFWGKWFTAAMMGYGYAPSAEHRATVDRAVRELMATQSADGYIGTYPDSCHLGDWDIWGRKYVLLGLLAYYDQTKETAALEAARRVADHLIAEAGPGSGTNIAATGWIGWKGLASCSVLEPITLLYQRTGEKRYLDFARHIVRSWDEPNRLAPAGLRLIQEAIGETAPWKMSGAPKAYEMMSCFEGLCELYRVTAEPLYLEAVQRLVDALVRDEIMIAGSGSVAEIWCHSAVRQSEPLYQGMETCVTATWMKLMYQMLRLTGDSRCADRLETSLYNALLGAMSPRGEWWAYYSGLMGERVHSHQQFPDVVMSCCVANGPRGLMITPSWAAMTGPDGVALNLYAPLQAEVATPDGQSLKIDMQTVYPADGRVRIAVGLPKSEAFALRLRIPQWSERTSLRINGAPYDGYLIPGTYASIERTWNEGDRIELDLDMRARVVDAPSGSGDRARTGRAGVRHAPDTAARRRERAAHVSLRVRLRCRRIHRRDADGKSRLRSRHDVRRSLPRRSGRTASAADVRLRLGGQLMAGRQPVPHMDPPAVRLPPPVRQQPRLAHERDRQRRTTRNPGAVP